MKVSTRRFGRWRTALAATALGTIAALGLGAAPAMAHDGWHRGWDRGDWHRGRVWHQDWRRHGWDWRYNRPWVGFGYYAPPPVIYGPPPPPVVYSPPPVYYPGSLNVYIPLR